MTMRSTGTVVFAVYIVPRTLLITSHITATVQEALLACVSENFCLWKKIRKFPSFLWTCRYKRPSIFPEHFDLRSFSLGSSESIEIHQVLSFFRTWLLIENNNWQNIWLILSYFMKSKMSGRCFLDFRCRKFSQYRLYLSCPIFSDKYRSFPTFFPTPGITW